MNALNRMPEHEKYQHAFTMVSLYQKHVLPFVEDRLGFSAMHNLRSVWQAAIVPIRDDDSDHDKYERAYNNWHWIALCSHNALADELSSDEILDYKNLLLQLYEQQVNPANLNVLRMLKAYNSLAERLLYELQWMTPVNEIRSSKKQVVGEICNCKVLQTPEAERICRVDCQHIGRAYAKRIYLLNRVTSIDGSTCTITLTPLGN